MESVAFIQWCLEHLNYWTITLLMTIESSFIPFPSEVIIPPAAYKAAVNDELNIYLVVLFATIGADIGALINYYLAKWLGRPLFINLPTAASAHVSDRRSQSTTCRILFRQAWRTFHLHRPIDSGSSPTDFHTGRTCPHENAHLPVVYHYRSRIMEYNPRHNRVLPLDSARHRKRRTTDCQSNRIQPRNRLLLHRNRNIHRGLPGS